VTDSSLSESDSGLGGRGVLETEVVAEPGRVCGGGHGGGVAAMPGGGLASAMAAAPHNRG
jgi:hypothetical protein